MVEITLEERLGERVRTFRKRKGWNQRDLSDNSGVARGTVANIERFQGNINTQTLNKLAKALDVDVSEFYK